LRTSPSKRAEVRELLQAFKIIYSIYEKYSDEKEAERILMEETTKIKSIHMESESEKTVKGKTVETVVTTKKVIKKKGGNSDDEDDEKSKKKKRVKSGGTKQVQ
jgi:hypothetical protein